MGEWDEIYSNGSIHTEPSKEIKNLVPALKSKGVKSVLDAGCGTGRHSIYLAKKGFDVHGIDISQEAISIAKRESKGQEIDYRVTSLYETPFEPRSMDFILANHSLEYISNENVKRSVREMDSLLRKNKPFFMRVASTEHPFYEASPEEVYGFSHIGFCIKEGLPVHFYDEEEIRELFSNYRIERLEHVRHEVDHEKISVPLREWVMLAYKE